MKSNSRRHTGGGKRERERPPPSSNFLSPPGSGSCGVPSPTTNFLPNQSLVHFIKSLHIGNCFAGNRLFIAVPGWRDGWKVVGFSNSMEAEGDVNPIMGSPPLQVPTPLLLFSPPLQHQATPPLSITPLHLNWTNWVKHLHRLDIKLTYISTLTKGRATKSDEFSKKCQRGRGHFQSKKLFRRFWGP